MGEMRWEKDLLGTREVPAGALHGIHTARALENFPLSLRPVNPLLIHAYGAVKLACLQTNAELGFLEDANADAIARACQEMMEGKLDGHVVVDALQGGAGTSTNMNVNEVLANRALQILGLAPGAYETIDPHAHINLHQSTNDTYPTALRIAAIWALRLLEPELVGLLEAFQQKEKEFANVVKVGRTQMQDAVLTTLGREMSAYAEAIGRDRWRLYKCEERLRVVNLGGTAVGTGITAPREYIFAATEHLRAITGLGLSRSENLIDATQNADAFVEVSGNVKACAANLLKICGDLRFLASGPDAGIAEIRLPQKQAGSSIMPGKVNPVIPEAVSQAAMVVMANDCAITQACALGHLELNPFLPLVSDALLESIHLLARACSLLRRHCIAGIEANREQCKRHVEGTTALVTAMVEVIGYEAAQEIAHIARDTGKPVRELILERGLMTREGFDQIISSEHVTRLGSRPGRP